MGKEINESGKKTEKPWGNVNHAIIYSQKGQSKTYRKQVSSITAEGFG